MNAPHSPHLAGDALRRAVTLRDLTDPARGPHAMQLIVDDVLRALAARWPSLAVTIHRAPPVVSVEDNYDALGYAQDAVARDARYSRYVSERALLRTQTSALIPPLLRARAPDGVVDDELLACPGLVYRRDCIDKLHVGEPHQLDLWRMARDTAPGAALGEDALLEMIDVVVGAALPGAVWRVTDAEHPYTQRGRQIDVELAKSGNTAPRLVEIGECGLAHPTVLASAGIDVARVSGLAMGLGLDRLVMLRKGLDDIRLLRAADERVASQMLDLAPYRAVSRMPPMRRDLSIVVDAARTPEELGDLVRDALGDDASVIEDLAVKSETSYYALPLPARERLRIAPHQKNVLLRVVLRALDRTLSDDDGNALRDRIYAAVHEGEVDEWTARSPGS